MATRKFHLSEEAIDALKRAEKATKKSSELRRMQAVRLYGSGQPVKQIVEVTRMKTRNILDCVARYRQKGLAGLKEYPQKGNRTLLTDAQRAELAGKLHPYRPVNLPISQREYWTVSDLAVAVEQWYGVVYKHRDGYLRILHASGFTFSAARRSIVTSRARRRWRRLTHISKKSDRLFAGPPGRAGDGAGRDVPVFSSDYYARLGSSGTNARRARQSPARPRAFLRRSEPANRA